MVWVVSTILSNWHLNLCHSLPSEGKDDDGEHGITHHILRTAIGIIYMILKVTI